MEIKKFDNEEITQILENAFAYIVVMAMFAYGIGKIIQFDGALQLTKRFQN